MPEINVTINARGAIRGAKKVVGAFNTISRKGQSLITGVFSPMNTALAAIGGTAALVGITRITDQFTVMAAQLEYVTGSTQDAADVEEELYGISRRTGTVLEDNAATYVKLSQAQAMTNLSSKENLKVIEGLNSLMVRTGTTGVQASSAMLQLGQALTSGKLAGDEFRSMAENAPGVLNEMSKAMGIARSDLKQMATDGELTSDRLGAALLQIANDGESSMTELPKTVARGWNSVVLAFSEAWDKINDKTGIMSYLFEALESLANWIEDNTWRFSAWIESLMAAIQENWPAIETSINDLWAKLVIFMDGIGEKTPGLMQNISSISSVLVTLVGWLGKAVEGYQFLLDAYNTWSNAKQTESDVAANNAFLLAGSVAQGHSLAESGAAVGLNATQAAQTYNTYINTPVNKDVTRQFTEEQKRQGTLL